MKKMVNYSRYKRKNKDKNIFCKGFKNGCNCILCWDRAIKSIKLG